jgi:hypothetical protein
MSLTHPASVKQSAAAESINATLRLDLVTMITPPREPNLWISNGAAPPMSAAAALHQYFPITVPPPNLKSMPASTAE